MYEYQVGMIDLCINAPWDANTRIARTRLSCGIVELMPSSAIVEAGQGGVHLSIFAAKSFRSLASRRQSKAAAARGELLVNGVVPSRGHVVQTGERVELMQADKTVVVQPIPSPVKASQNPTDLRYRWFRRRSWCRHHRQQQHSPLMLHIMMTTLPLSGSQQE